ncbi:hypothetical protein pb186bvf_007999 [Paramecium bursaria]
MQFVTSSLCNFCIQKNVKNTQQQSSNISLEIKGKIAEKFKKMGYSLQDHLGEIIFFSYNNIIYIENFDILRINLSIPCFFDMITYLDNKTRQLTTNDLNKILWLQMSHPYYTQHILQQYIINLQNILQLKGQIIFKTENQYLIKEAQIRRASNLQNYQTLALSLNQNVWV